MSEAQELVDAVFAELAEQQSGPFSLHDCSPLPLTEAECGWSTTGLIWEGYSSRDVAEICRAIAAQVTLSLAVAGFLRAVSVVGGEDGEK